MRRLLNAALQQVVDGASSGGAGDVGDDFTINDDRDGGATANAQIGGEGAVGAKGHLNHDIVGECGFLVDQHGECFALGGAIRAPSFIETDSNRASARQGLLPIFLAVRQRGGGKRDTTGADDGADKQAAAELTRKLRRVMAVIFKNPLC